MKDKIKSVHLVENSLKMQTLQGEKLAPRIEGQGIELTWSDMVDGIEECESAVHFIMSLLVH